jgi:hypothetical protein
MCGDKPTPAWVAPGKPDELPHRWCLSIRALGEHGGRTPACCGGPRDGRAGTTRGTSGGGGGMWPVDVVEEVWQRT